MTGKWHVTWGDGSSKEFWLTEIVPAILDWAITASLVWLFYRGITLVAKAIRPPQSPPQDVVQSAE